MTEFVERVRRSKVPQPTQVKFTVDRWSSEYIKVAKPSEADARLYEAGVWFDRAFRAVRAQVAALTSTTATGSDRVRVLVGFVNRETAVVETKLREQQRTLASERQVISQDDLLQAKVSSPLVPFDQSPIPLIESIINSARYPLADALTRPSPSGGTNTFDDVPLIANYSGVYDSLERLWMECLWHGWSVTRVNGVDVIGPPDNDLMRSDAVAAYRRDALLFEVGIHAATVWDSMHPLEKKEYISNRPRVVDITRSKKRRRIVLGLDSLGDRPPRSLAYAAAIDAVYLDGALGEPLPKLGGLRASDLLATWDVLASYGEVEAARRPSFDVINGAQLSTFAPTIDIAELARTVQQATGLDGSRSRQAVGVFVFDGNHRDDLWLRPLVKVDTERVTPVLAALLTPNLLRSLEYWMQIGGYDLSERGRLFEQEVRLRLSQTTRLPNAAVAKYAVIVERNDGSFGEEIDLLIRVDETLIVGECKCVAYPDTPLEFHDFYEALRNGAEQARRKADFVGNNVAATFAAAGWNHTAVTRMVPVVVSSTSLGAGHKFSGVDCVDPGILGSFLHGEFSVRSAKIEDGAVKTLSETKPYTSPSEAAAAFPTYIAEPPQVTRFRQFVRRRFVPHFPVQGLDPSGFSHFCVEIPSGSLPES